MEGSKVARNGSCKYTHGRCVALFSELLTHCRVSRFSISLKIYFNLFNTIYLPTIKSKNIKNACFLLNLLGLKNRFCLS